MPLLAVNDYSKIFEIHHLGRQIPVFQHLTFDLMAGQFLLVSGPNGIGKSTLLRCLFRSYLPSSGQAPLRSDGDNIFGKLNAEVGFGYTWQGKSKHGFFWAIKTSGCHATSKK